MEREEKHTPLPWRMGNGAIISEHVVGDRPMDEETRAYYGGEVICETVTPANAELIIRAVNSHAELLAAAKAMLERIDGDSVLGAAFSEYRGGPPFVVKNLRAAIAAAEPNTEAK